MSTTTIRLNTSTRDRLSAIAQRDFGGLSQDATLNRLIDEHEMAQVHAAYERLRNDPDEWADYLAEIAEWDTVAADGLGDAHEEYPEYNR